MNIRPCKVKLTASQICRDEKPDPQPEPLYPAICREKIKHPPPVPSYQGTACKKKCKDPPLEGCPPPEPLTVNIPCEKSNLTCPHCDNQYHTTSQGS
ncbi:hypothetical protein EVAR_41540_1 [Eumeta japonica]|uniref:Uncharacterized protein n=1 Tax=Eumeta variegata TaxID=151549 RepID=A0A4C1X416_EUMVA|nr:hypothetical protein EVAR_41540_1 [Eumeta japonica]